MVHKDSALNEEAYAHPVLILNKRTDHGEEVATFVICWSHGGQGIDHLPDDKKRDHLLVGESEDPNVKAHLGTLALPLAAGSDTFEKRTYVQIYTRGQWGPGPDQLLTYDIEVKHLEKYASDKIKLSGAAVRRVNERRLYY